MKEIQLHSLLVTKDSYLVVFDTVIEDMPDDFSPECPCGKGNNPKTAVDENPKKLSRDWICESARYRYSYNFSWMGRPIIHYLKNMITM